MVLIVGFDEQHWSGAESLGPLDVVPILRVPFGFSKKLGGSGSMQRMRLSLPSLQAGLASFRIGVDRAQIHSRNHRHSFDTGILSRCISGNEPAKAVPDHDELACIY